MVTDRNIEMAERLARTRVSAEKMLDVAGPSAQPLDDEDIQDLAFKITGIKYEFDSDEADVLATAYIDAYYDEWEQG